MKVKIHHIDKSIEILNVSPDIVGADLDDFMDAYVDVDALTAPPNAHLYWYEVYHNDAWITENEREQMLNIESTPKVSSMVAPRSKTVTVIDNITNSINETKSCTVTKAAVFKVLQYIYRLTDWERSDFYDYIHTCQEAEADIKATAAETLAPERAAYIKFFDMVLVSNATKKDFFANRVPFALAIAVCVNLSLFL